MTQENTVADLVEQIVAPMVEETPAAVATEAGAVEEPVIEDYRGKFEAAEQARVALEAQIAKERQDWKSQKNELLIKKHREDMVAKIAARLGVDAETIADDVTGQMQSFNQQQVQDTYAEQADAIASSVRQIAANANINLTGEDAKRATRIWQYGQSLWEDGKVEESMREFREAESEMKDTVERVTRRSEREAARVRAEEERIEAVDSGALDLAGARPQGGAPSSLDAVLKENPANMNPAQLKEYKEKVYRAMEATDKVTYRR